MLEDLELIFLKESVEYEIRNNYYERSGDVFKKISREKKKKLYSYEG